MSVHLGGILSQQQPVLARDLGSALSESRPVALGSAFGATLAYFFFALASNERKERVKHELER